jgi:hypothetical protein
VHAHVRAHTHAHVRTRTHARTHARTRDANFYISALSVAYLYLQDTRVICIMNNTQNVMVECIGRLQVQILVWRPAIWTDFFQLFFSPSPYYNTCQENTSN